MEDYSSAYDDRPYNRKIRREEYKEEHLSFIKIKIDKYLKDNPLKGSEKNPEHFNDFAFEVNSYHERIDPQNWKERKISGRYIFEIFHNKGDKKKIKRRVEALEDFLNFFLSNGNQILNTHSANSNIVTHPDWVGTVVEEAQQGADHRYVSLDKRLFKSIRCEVFTMSPYYRFGIKLFAADSNIFGELTIETKKGFNIVMHTAKDFTSNQHFITCIEHGRKIKRFYFINLHTDGKPYHFYLHIDEANFLKLVINHEEVYKIAVLPELCQHLCMYVWGDHHKPDPEVHVKNIKIETR